jgi:hypothetical protein
MKKYLLFLPLLLLFGCTPDSPGISETKRVEGEINGRILYRMTITNADHYNHYVYFFKDEGKQPISVNYKSGNLYKVIFYIDDKPASTNYLVEDPNK